MTGYTHRILVAYASGLFQPGHVAHVQVAHDHDCPATRGHVCACIPEITVTTEDGVIHVAADGNIRKESKQ